MFSSDTDKWIEGNCRPDRLGTRQILVLLYALKAYQHSYLVFMRLGATKQKKLPKIPSFPGCVVLVPGSGVSAGGSTGGFPGLRAPETRTATKQKRNERRICILKLRFDGWEIIICVLSSDCNGAIWDKMERNVAQVK